MYYPEYAARAQSLSNPLPLILSDIDAAIIHCVEKYVRIHERGLITDCELVNSMLDGLSDAETDDGIIQAVARLPHSVHGILRDCVSAIRESNNPGQRFVFWPREPSGIELEELNCRVRHVVGVLEKFLASPVAARGIAQLRDKKSKFLLCLETVPNTSCRKEACDLPRVKRGIYCPEHHYQMLQNLETCTE